MTGCKFDGCTKPHKSRGLCDTHYAYWRRTGRIGQREALPLADRFWPKVDKTPGLGPNGDCWEWRAYVHPTGYGQIGLGSAKQGVCHTHRVSWMLTHGEIPKGLLVMHKCDNRLCVNPAHLRLGTHKDNTQDMLAKGRGRAPEGYARGSKITKSKLTDEMVRQMRAETGMTYKQLSEKYGVNPGTCHRVVTRQTWAHVE